MNSPTLAPFHHHLDRTSTLLWRGRVLQVIGNLIESEGPFCSVGECCEIRSVHGDLYTGEIVGFRGSTMLSMVVGDPQGIRFGDTVTAIGTRPSVRVGPELLGRVIEKTIHEHRPLGRGRHGKTHVVPQLVVAINNLHRAPTEHEARTHEHGITDFRRGRDRLRLGRIERAALGPGPRPGALDER